MPEEHLVCRIDEVDRQIEFCDLRQRRHPGTIAQARQHLRLRTRAQQAGELDNVAGQLYHPSVELIEFEGKHISHLSGTVLPGLLAFAQRLPEQWDVLRPVHPALLPRSFVGLFFSYFMTGMLMRDRFPAELEPKAFDTVVDIYLHGILAVEEKRKG